MQSAHEVSVDSQGYMFLQSLNRRIIAQDIIPDDGISHGLSHSCVRWSDGVTTEIDFSIEHDSNIFSSDAVVSTLLATNAPSRSEMRLLALYMECLELQSQVIGFAFSVNTYVDQLSALTQVMESSCFISLLKLLM